MFLRVGTTVIGQVSKVFLQFNTLLLSLGYGHINHGLIPWKQAENVNKKRTLLHPLKLIVPRNWPIHCLHNAY